MVTSLKFNINKIPASRGKFEIEVAKGLLHLQKDFKYEFDYETDRLDYTTTHYYTPDWTVVLPSGKRFFIESKGYLGPDDRRILKAVKAQNPDIDLRLLFQRNNKLSKTSPNKYSDWAERLGFPWCVGAIPTKWLNE